MLNVTVARDKQTSAAKALRALKLLHTLVWAIFALSIVSIPVFAWMEAYSYAAVLICLVMVEVLVLLANGWRCPLTTAAARLTADRHDNFDIYLPEWLARHNKGIFGTLYVLGIAFTAALWIERTW